MQNAANFRAGEGHLLDKHQLRATAAYDSIYPAHIAVDAVLDDRRLGGRIPCRIPWRQNIDRGRTFLGTHYQQWASLLS